MPVTRNGTPNGRKRGDEALINALAVGVSVAAAAEHAGLSRRTAYRRLEDPAFRARVDEARAGIVSGVVGRLSGIGVLAGDTLKNLLGDSSSSIRLGAAKAALEFMFRGNEQDTLARQLRELQEQIEALKGQDADPDVAPEEPPRNPTRETTEEPPRDPTRETSHAQSDARSGPEAGGSPAASDGPASGAVAPEDGADPALAAPPRPADDCL
jgi:hypothetical protein